MKNKTIPLYIAILLAIISLLSCNKTSEVDTLNQRVDELVTLIEQHKESDVKNYLTRQFTVAQRFNKPQFLRYLNYHMKRNKNILITLTDKNIVYSKDYADVTANVLLVGSSAWIPERGQIYTVASRWIKESGAWKMSKLRWDKK